MGWNWAIWAGTELPLLSSSTAGPVPSCSGKTLCHSVVTSHLSSYQSSFVCFTHLLLPDTNQDRCHGRGVLSVVICSRHLFKTSNLRGLLSINSHTKSSWASARAGIGESIWRAGWLKHQGPKNVPGRCYWTTISIAKPWILTTSIWRHSRRKEAWFFWRCRAATIPLTAVSWSSSDQATDGGALCWALILPTSRSRERSHAHSGHNRARTPRQGTCNH